MRPATRAGAAGWPGIRCSTASEAAAAVRPRHDYVPSGANIRAARPRSCLSGRGW
jgi:hypothetical protein